MSALSRAFFSAAVWAALLAPGSAEVVIGGGVIINGAIDFGRDGAVEPTLPAPDPAGPQVLEFTSGEQLHGTLEALDVARGEVTWRRSDASGPLLIPLAQISRLSSEERPRADAPARATVKFTGGDWLAAEVTAIEGDRIHLQLGDGVRCTTDRSHVEWISFSKNGAAECYDGPTSISGWIFASGWTYRDGALRASAPVPITRMFQALPDRVEYRMTVDQGGSASAFTLSLHARSTTVRWMSRGIIQLMIRANSLHLWASIDGNYKTVQTDLTSLLSDPLMRAKGPLHLRILEDFTGGRLLVYLNGRKAAEWAIDKGEASKNGGGLQFQPTSWSGEKEQSLANIKVLPWDGREPAEDDESGADRVVLTSGGLKTGKVASWNGRTLKLGASTIARAEIAMLRFRRPANPPEDAAPVARVRLGAGGEFDVVRLGWRDGRVLIETNFGGEIALPPGAITGLDFPRVEAKDPPPGDALVFRNGDRLRGSLVATNDTGQVRWRTGGSASFVEFSPGNIASLLFTPRVARLPGSVVARFRNGDWLSGTFLTLDREQVVLNTAEAGQLSIPRHFAKALYFSADGAPAVSDGTSDHEVWERGLNLNPNTATARSKPVVPGSPWSYAAGGYSLRRSARTDPNYNANRGLQLGRVFDALPRRVEVSFSVRSEQNPIYFNAQLFTEPGNPGYMLHLSTVGLSIYDLSPRPRGRGIVPQQFSFGKEIKPDARERHLRVLADRTSGRMTVFVDGVLTAQITPRFADGPRELGRGFMLAPQSPPPCTFSNFWVGPWNGLAPGKETDATPESIALTNGDEVAGTVELATPTMMRMASEVGPLDLPIERLTAVDFGGPAVERRAQTRLQLAGQGALTISAWRIENDTVICRSEIAGDLKLPTASIQEIIFVTSPPPAATN